MILNYYKDYFIYIHLLFVQMSNSAVQCLALAMICDATRAGCSVGQLVTWRANLAASHAVNITFQGLGRSD